MDASKNDRFCFVWDETNGKKVVTKLEVVY